MTKRDEFEREVQANILSLGHDVDLQALSRIWGRETSKHRYTHNFSWMGRPIIQFPQDVMAMQELLWSIKPDLIVETGIAHGGSLICYASILALLDMCDAANHAVTFNPRESRRKVLGIDIDIRAHNRAAVEAHPMASRIHLIQGSSIAADVIAEVCEFARGYNNVLVCLDSNHTHEHVLAELEAYAPLTSIGSYCVVFDTLIEDMPADFFPDRPWGVSNNPKTAVWEYLKSHAEFEIDKSIEHKLLITVAPDGYLKRVR